MSPGIPLTPSTFTAKYAARFPDQQFELVVPADFRELAADTATTFLTAPAARALFSAGKVLSYSAATGAFTLPAASAVQSGYLTAADYIAFAAKQVALGFQPENVANRGTANGYAPLDSASLIPSVYLPSYVDGIAEYATFSAFPAVGLTGKIYLADDDLDGQWRWSPSSNSYRKFNSSIGTTDNLVEGATNRYFTMARVLASTLNGYVKSVLNAALDPADSILVAFQKLEKKADDNTTGLAPLLKTITVGTNVGNGSQAPVSVGGYQANVTGLESASLGGGANTISGNDSATVGGSQLTIAGNSNGIVGGGYSGISGTLSGQLGGYGNNNAATQAAIAGGRGLRLLAGSDNSVIVGGLGFTAPVQQETLFAPQIYVFKNGGGVSLVSPDGNTRAVLTLSNTGQLLLNGTAIGSAGSGTAPTITNPTFSGSGTAPTITNPTFSAS